MSDGEAELIFKGRSPGSISCEEFVRAVRTHALSVNRTRDNEYMADYAMACLTDDALHWSEMLSRDIQTDWSRFRQALLAEYGSINRQPIPASATIPSAGSAHFAIGRISVIVDPISDYLEIADQAHARCLASRDISKAATLEAIDTDGGIELRFTSPASRSGSWLGIIWHSSPTEAGSYAALVPVERRGASVCVPSELLGWSGPVSVVKWTRSASHILSPILVLSQGALTHGFLTTLSDGIDVRFLDMTNDIESFRRGAGTGWKETRFLFERL